MSITALLTQPVTLRQPTGTYSAADAIGFREPQYRQLATVMALQPRSGSEDDATRNTEIGDWKGYGLPDIDFTSWSQVVFGQVVFDITSPPRLIPNPRTGGYSHWEVDLRAVDQQEDIA